MSQFSAASCANAWRQRLRLPWIARSR